MPRPPPGLFDPRPEAVERTARFSPCMRYRYTLWRDWSDLFNPSTGFVMFVGLNPSTADDFQDDPTIRRCISFANEWGYTALCMTNAFALRSPYPRDLKRSRDPVGPKNDATLTEIATSAALIVAAWGQHITLNDRHLAMATLLPKVHCLGLTKGGYPRHPLYLSAATRPVPFNHTVPAAQNGNQAL